MMYVKIPNFTPPIHTIGSTMKGAGFLECASEKGWIELFLVIWW